MLELFSRIPDALHYEGEGHLTPIPMEEEASSLSAILLDEDYYAFLHEGKIEMGGVSMVRPEHILPLKARAWLDLTARKDVGEKIDTTNIRKHRNDVFRLYLILTPENIPQLGGQVAEDLRSFLDTMEEQNLQLNSFGYPKGTRADSIIGDMRESYGINS